MKNLFDKSYIALFCGVLALSTSAIFVKISSAPSSVTAFYRLLITAVVLIPFLIFNANNRREIFDFSKKQIVYVVFSGLLLAVHYVMWFESMRFTSVSSATVLVALQPLFSILWSFLFLRERVTASALLGCLVAIFGSAVIGWGDLQVSAEALFGDILALVSAGVISMYFLVGQVARKNTGVITYSVFSYLSSVVFLFIYILFNKENFFGYSGTTWGAFLGLALISTIGGQFIFNLLLKNISATAVSMGILGEPIGTCILAFFILNETIAIRQLVGIVIILFGLSIYFFYPAISAQKCQSK